MTDVLDSFPSKDLTEVVFVLLSEDRNKAGKVRNLCYSISRHNMGNRTLAISQPCHKSKLSNMLYKLTEIVMKQDRSLIN
jgi:hypothetical protein